MAPCLGHILVWGLVRVCTRFLLLGLAHLVNSLVLCESVLLASTRLASLFLLRKFIIPNKGGDRGKILEVGRYYVTFLEGDMHKYLFTSANLETIKDTTLPKSSFVNRCVY